MTNLTWHGPKLDMAADCEAVLRSLPMWFGVEASLVEYVDDSAKLPGFALFDSEGPQGFLSLKQHGPLAWEITCIGVHARARGRGLGRQLVAQAEAWLVGQGARFLQVKTLADTHPSPEYAQTRAFYAALGFTPLEVFPLLWAPEHPVLMLVKGLG